MEPIVLLAIDESTDLVLKLRIFEREQERRVKISLYKCKKKKEDQILEEVLPKTE